jgi:hypothetical protein
MSGQRAVAEDEFLAIVYADDEFLRAEFDAIIQAGWGVPNGQASPPSPRPWPGRRSPAPQWRPTLRLGPADVVSGIRSRQRSPPDPVEPPSAEYHHGQEVISWNWLCVKQAGPLVMSSTSRHPPRAGRAIRAYLSHEPHRHLPLGWGLGLTSRDPTKFVRWTAYRAKESDLDCGDGEVAGWSARDQSPQ